MSFPRLGKSKEFKNPEMEMQVKRAFKSFFGKKNNTKAESASNFVQPLVQDSLF